MKTKNLNQSLNKVPLQFYHMQNQPPKEEKSNEKHQNIHVQKSKLGERGLQGKESKWQTVMLGLGQVTGWKVGIKVIRLGNKMAVNRGQVDSKWGHQGVGFR